MALSKAVADRHGQGSDEKIRKRKEKTVDSSRPTDMRVHSKYVSPATLEAYALPWEWDDAYFVLYLYTLAKTDTSG